MAELFENVFSPNKIYNTLFFTVKAVLRNETLEDLEKENPALHKHWEYLARIKYNNKYDDIKAQTIYANHAVNHPEFNKIVAVTYGTVYLEDGKPKRFLKKIVNQNEFVVLRNFMDELHQLSRDGMHSNPKSFPTLCGYDISSHDIPHLLKKFVMYRNEFEDNKQIPLILKQVLSMKPWESGVIDVSTIWKFNGYDKTPLMLIADAMGLKYVTELHTHAEMSLNYWELVRDDPDKAMEYVSLQSATQTNFAIQIMNEFRQL